MKMTQEIQVQTNGNLGSGEDLVSLFTIKLKEPVQEMSEEYFKIRNKVLKQLNEEIIYPVNAFKSNNSGK